MESLRLFSVKPDLKQTRNSAHLLVFGDLGAWLVVDDELLSLLKRFDGTVDLHQILKRHAAQWQRPMAEVRAEALPLIQNFISRGVLRKNNNLEPLEEEPLSIANVTLNLTNRCNLKCSFCYNGSRIGEEVALDDLADFLRVGRRAMSSDASLIILGGEPLIDANRLFGLLERVGDLFVRPPMISTNGTRLDQQMVSRLAATRVEVQVSIDSANPEVHDSGRGAGVHAKALAGIRRLVDAGVYTIISMVFKQSTIAEMAGLLDLANALGVNEARFIPLRGVGAASNTNAVNRDLPDLMAAFETLLTTLEKHPEYGRLLLRDFFSIAAAQCRHASSRVSCGIGRRVIFIDADGKLYPCPNHVKDAFYLGDVRVDSLEHVLRRSDAMRFVRNQYHVSRYSKCTKCPFKRWCAGDCRGEVLANTNDPHAASIHCQSLKKMYLRILWLLADDDPRIGSVTASISPDEVSSRFLV